ARFDAPHRVEITPIDDGDVVRTEGATLRAIHTPGHAEDHLCFALEEENAIFSGDNVLGVGTTVIPAEGGDLLDYMHSLERLLAEQPTAIYPAHGPMIRDGRAKLREYIDHRNQREQEILAALRSGLSAIPEIVARVYAAYPVALHGPARSSVCSHLLKLEREGRVRRGRAAPRDARGALAAPTRPARRCAARRPTSAARAAMPRRRPRRPCCSSRRSSRRSATATRAWCAPRRARWSGSGA